MQAIQWQSSSNNQHLSQRDLQKISDQISQKFERELKSTGLTISGELSLNQSVVLRKSQQVVFLLRGKRKNHQEQAQVRLDSDSKRDQNTFFAFLALVNLDKISTSSSPDDYMCLLKIEAPEYLTNRFTEKLPFLPHEIRANKIEGSFLLIGKRGILVGNLPDYLGQKGSSAQQQRTIQCESIDPFLFEENESCAVTQAEFSYLDTNFVFALIRQTHCEQRNHALKVYSLRDNGMKALLEYNLHDMVPSNKYGRFNRDLEFVSFSQCAPSSQDLLTLDVFSIHLLTSCGDIYLLNPVILETMIFKENHFSQILNQLQEQIEEDPSNGLLKKLRLEFIRSKTNITQRPCFCLVTLSTETVQKFQPALQGPYRLQNQPHSQVKNLAHKQIFMAYPFPLALAVVSANKTDLVVSYEQPKFVFKGQETRNEQVFVVSSSFKHPDNYDQVSVTFVTTETNESHQISSYKGLNEGVFLNLKAASKRAAINYRLDLQALETVKESLQTGNEVDFGQLDFMKVLLIHQSNHENQKVLLDEAGPFQVLVNMEKLRVEIKFKDAIEEDQSQSLIQKLDSLRQNKEERARLLRNHKPSEVDWKPENSWIKKLDVVKAPDSNKDVKAEDFKHHFENFQAHYIDHFSNQEDIFQSKMASLNKLRSELKSKSERIIKMKQENQASKAEMDRLLKQINDSSQLIEERTQNVKMKVRSITCPYPDDLVLQVFVGRLEEQVLLRNSQKQLHMKQANQMLDQERETQESLGRPRQWAKNELIQKLERFVLDHKPRIEQMSRQIASIQKNE